MIPTPCGGSEAVGRGLVRSSAELHPQQEGIGVPIFYSIDDFLLPMNADEPRSYTLFMRYNP